MRELTIGSRKRRLHVDRCAGGGRRTLVAAGLKSFGASVAIQSLLRPSVVHAQAPTPAGNITPQAHAAGSDGQACASCHVNAGANPKRGQLSIRDFRARKK